jgi:hypothetical protein
VQFGDIVMNLAQPTVWDASPRLLGTLSPTLLQQTGLAGFEKLLIGFARENGFELERESAASKATYTILNALSPFVGPFQSVLMFMQDVAELLRYPYMRRNMERLFLFSGSPLSQNHATVKAVQERFGMDLHLFNLPEGPEITPHCLICSASYFALRSATPWLPVIWMRPMASQQGIKNALSLLLSFAPQVGTVILFEFYGESCSRGAFATSIPTLVLDSMSEPVRLPRTIGVDITPGSHQPPSFMFLEPYQVRAQSHRRLLPTSVFNIAEALGRNPGADDVFAQFGVKAEYRRLDGPREVTLSPPVVFEGCDRGLEHATEYYYSGRTRLPEVGILSLEDVSVVGAICQIISGSRIFIIPDEFTRDLFSFPVMPLTNTEGDALMSREENLGTCFWRDGDDFLMRANSDFVDAVIEDECVMLGGKHITNHGHFLFDILPSALYAKKLGIERDAKYLIGPNVMDYQLKYLPYAGVPLDRVVKSSHRTVQCRRLHVGSQLVLRPSPGIHPLMLEFFDEFAERVVTAASGPDLGEKIVISRLGISFDKRRLLNEAQIVRFLEDEGFTWIDELVDVDILVPAIRRAKLIIAVFGAGATNLGFASPGARIFFIHPGRVAHWAECYYLCQRPDQSTGFFFVDSFDTPLKEALSSQLVADFQGFRAAYRRWRE